MRVVEVEYYTFKSKIMSPEDKKAMLARKTTFIKNMPRYTSCKSAYKKGFQDALEYINNKPEKALGGN